MLYTKKYFKEYKMEDINNLSVNINSLVNQEVIDKDSFYKDQFESNDFCWGFGIEHETYIDTGIKYNIKLKDALKSIKRERYSVDYTKYYKSQHLDNISSLDSDKIIEIPLWLNSHSLTKVDFKRNHKTLYTKLTEPNPLFSMSIYDKIKEKDKWFENVNYEHFIFDGDAIEFVTRYFYKKTIEEVIKELEERESEFVSRLQKNFVSWKATIPKIYNGITNLWSCYSKGYSIFNNGTYHLNLTLPFHTNEEGNIKDIIEFKEKHLHVIRWLQWFEPLLLAVFGYPDFFSTIFPEAPYAKGSLRGTMSRYIGIGTFNPDEPIEGKQLNTNLRLPWMHRVQDESIYELNSEHGLDINFMKHRNHGIEWRIFDAFPTEHLQEISILMLFIADYALKKDNFIPTAQTSDIWNQTTFDCIFAKGSDSLISPTYCKLIGLDVEQPIKPIEVLNVWIDKVYNEFEMEGWGECVKYLLKNKRKPNLNHFNHDITNLFTQYYK